jgi:hypothetical protein
MFAAIRWAALLAAVVVLVVMLPQLASRLSPAKKRAVHLTPDRMSDADFRALALLQPHWVVVLSAQLGDPDPLDQVAEDPRLEGWLRVHQEVQPIVRMWPVKSPEPAAAVAARISALHQRYPWIQYFIPANEPDIEWGDSTSWREIAGWTAAVWHAVDEQRRSDHSGVKLLFPPVAQGSRLQPEAVGFDAVRATIELYLDHGDGIAGHEYWDRGNLFLVENTWPGWLQSRLAGAAFFVTECGWRPVKDNGVADAELGRELVSFARNTRAAVVAPFLLSSAGGTFEDQALVDHDGVPRPTLYSWAQGVF